MTRVILTLAGFSLAVLMGAAVAGEKGAPIIEGTWLAVSAVADGKKVPDEFLAKFMLTLTFKDGKYAVGTGGKQQESGTYKADTSKKPPTLDMMVEEGKDKGKSKSQLAIYKIDADTLTVALGEAGSGIRPKSFEPGDKIEVTVFKRKK
jgi:uncharacterized protein (TIGR03067 family)